MPNKGGNHFFHCQSWEQVTGSAPLLSPLLPKLDLDQAIQWGKQSLYNTVCYIPMWSLNITPTSAEISVFNHSTSLLMNKRSLQLIVLNDLLKWSVCVGFSWLRWQILSAISGRNKNVRKLMQLPLISLTLQLNIATETIHGCYQNLFLNLTNAQQQIKLWVYLIPSHKGNPVKWSRNVKNVEHDATVLFSYISDRDGDGKGGCLSLNSSVYLPKCEVLLNWQSREMWLSKKISLKEHSKSCVWIWF